MILDLSDVSIPVVLFKTPPPLRGMDAILAELKALREIVATLQPSDVPVPDLVPICEGVTGKGTHWE